MKFYVEGRGFIFPKHEEAIKEVGGEIVDNVEDADFVSILTPNFLHHQNALDAARRGKRVLVEKPLAISLKEAEELSKHSVYVCHQLRYLPYWKDLKKKDFNYIDIDFRAKRGDDYWKSWKGDKEKSGGVLFNLAIHYFDLAFWLFGLPESIDCEYADDRKAKGTFYSNNNTITWNFELGDVEDTRLFKINATTYNLATKENLHIQVYKDFINNKGLRAKEVLNLIDIIEKIYGHL